MVPKKFSEAILAGAMLLGSSGSASAENAGVIREQMALDNTFFRFEGNKAIIVPRQGGEVLRNFYHYSEELSDNKIKKLIAAAIQDCLDDNSFLDVIVNSNTILAFGDGESQRRIQEAWKLFHNRPMDVIASFLLYRNIPGAIDQFKLAVENALAQKIDINSFCTGNLERILAEHKKRIEKGEAFLIDFESHIITLQEPVDLYKLWSSLPPGMRGSDRHITYSNMGSQFNGYDIMAGALMDSLTNGKIKKETLFRLAKNTVNTNPRLFIWFCVEFSGVYSPDPKDIVTAVNLILQSKSNGVNIIIDNSEYLISLLGKDAEELIMEAGSQLLSQR